MPTARQGTHGMDIRGGEIHKEPNGTLALMLARFPHETETPVHNHHSWGVCAWSRGATATCSGTVTMMVPAQAMRKCPLIGGYNAKLSEIVTASGAKQSPRHNREIASAEKHRLAMTGWDAPTILRYTPDWEKILEPGDVVHFADTPGDIHSQQGVGAPVWELVFFGRDPNAKPRLYFNPAAKSVHAAQAIR